MATARDIYIRSLFDVSGYGLEIGPAYSPLLPRSDGFNVDVLDHADQKTLREKYRTADVDVSLIGHVDYVSDGRPMIDVIGKRNVYDFVYASHVIDHMPDLIGFLRDCEALLRPNGVLFLAVPDRRFCFDLFRPNSSLGQILEAHILRRERHSAATLFDHAFLHATRGGRIAWQKTDTQTIGLQPFDRNSLERVLVALKRTSYEDAHSWTFTPSTFRFLIKSIWRLGLSNLREKTVVVPDGFEFYVALSTDAATHDMPDVELLFDAIEEDRMIAIQADRPHTSTTGHGDCNDSIWKARYEEIMSSHSWRWTAPLRSLRRFFR